MVDHTSQGQNSAPHAVAAGYSLLYLACGLIWVLGGDVLLVGFVPHQWQSAIGSVKGAAFVLATALLLYLALRRSADAHRRAAVLKAAVDLAALARHYETLVKYASDIFLLADEQHRIVEANERAIEAYGYSREELIGMSIRDLRAEPYRDLLERDLERIVADHTVYQAVQRRKDGSTFPVEISGTVIVVEGHRYYQGIIRDISERKQAEEMVAASRQRFVALLDGIPDAAWMKDAEGRFLAVNEAYAKSIAVSTQEIVGKTDADLWPAEIAARFRTADQKVINTRTPIRQDEQLRTQEGERWFETIHTPIFNDAGAAVGTTGVARDITERYQARQALEESEARYRNLVELTPDAVAVLTLDGSIVSANPAGLRMFGCDSAAQVIGQSMYRFVPDDQQDTFKRRLAELIKHGSLREIESEYLRLDGTRFAVEVSSALIASRAGQPAVMTAILRDISERKRNSAKLVAVNHALRVLSECNGILVRAENEPELLQKICGTLTATGGYRLSWVGYVAGDALQPMQISWESGSAPKGAEWGPLTRSERADDLVWNVIDQGKTLWIQDVAHESAGEWHDAVLSRGLGALLDVPLKDGDQVIGVLVIGAARAHAFSADEVRLLEELGSDLAFGIRMLRIRKARDDALRSLNDSETKLRTVVEHTSDGIVMLDEAGTILFANTGAERILARPIATLVGSELDIPLSFAAPLELVIHDGTTATIELTEAETEWEGKPARIVALHDITARRQIERERQQHLQEMQDALIKTIEAMSLTVEKRDPYTAGHQARVAELAVAIGREMRLPQTQLDGIRLGAMIHDIGKIYIPAEILNRPGRLGEHEIGLIRTHPQVGFDIVKNVDFIWPVKEMIVQHHERIDGSGYPYGLKGEQIVLEARILAVADVVEAMSSHRPYRPALGPNRALQEVRLGSGTGYDADVVAACLRLFEERRFEFDFTQDQQA